MARIRASMAKRTPLLCPILIAAVAIVLSCSESTSPPVHPIVTGWLPPNMPLKDMASLPPSTVSLPAAAGSTASIVDYTAFQEGVIVDITIAGTISFGSHQMAAPINYSGPLDYLGIRLPNDPGCLLNARVQFSQISGSGNPFPNTVACLIPRTMGNYSVRALVGGQGTAIRGPMPVGNTWPCDSIRSAGGECYTTSGSQLITVAPVAADLDFEGTYSGVRSQQIFLPRFVNDSSGLTLVGFTNVVFTDSTFARGMPRRNLDHTWIFADPTDPGDSYWHKTVNTCYAGYLYCDVNIKETGNMVSLTRVNGVEHTDTVTIYCIDSMTIFNSDKVRQGLMAVLDSSGAGVDSVYVMGRAERGYFILQDTTIPGSKPYVYILPKKPNADACGFGGMPQQFSERPPNTKILAWGHDHPGIGYTMPCKDTLGNYEYDYLGNPIVRELLPGVSDEDWTEAYRRNDPSYSDYVGPVNTYYMQSDGTLLILRPGQLADAALKLSANHFKWQKGRCAWPRRKL
jgi:hypothetical protein